MIKINKERRADSVIVGTHDRQGVAANSWFAGLLVQDCEGQTYESNTKNIANCTKNPVVSVHLSRKCKLRSFKGLRRDNSFKVSKGAEDQGAEPFFFVCFVFSFSAHLLCLPANDCSECAH